MINIKNSLHYLNHHHPISHLLSPAQRQRKAKNQKLVHFLIALKILANIKVLLHHSMRKTISTKRKSQITICQYQESKLSHKKYLIASR